MTAFRQANQPAEVLADVLAKEGACGAVEITSSQAAQARKAGLEVRSHRVFIRYRFRARYHPTSQTRHFASPRVARVCSFVAGVRLGAERFAVMRKLHDDDTAFDACEAVLAMAGAAGLAMWLKKGRYR